MMKRDIHLSPEMLVEFLSVRKDEISPYVIVAGQPHRVQMMLSRVEEPLRNFSTFGYSFWTGKLPKSGVSVTVGNGGMYSPDTAISTEILCTMSSEVLLRIGSCGAMREDMEIGDYVVVDEVVRGDGVTTYYVDDGFVPRTDAELSSILEKVAGRKGRVHRGKVWTTDALLKETKELVNSKIKEGCIAVDMVTSPFVTISNLYGKRCAVLLVVSDNLITGEVGFSDIRLFDAENNMMDIALEFIERVAR